MFEQPFMPNSVKKDQTAPGVKKQKRFELEGEKRADEGVEQEIEATFNDQDAEETLVVESLERMTVSLEKLAKIRKNVEQLFEYAIIAGDEETAYLHVGNAFRYHLPCYHDLRENFLKFAKKKLLLNAKELGKSRKLRLEKLAEKVKSGAFAEETKEKEEEPEIGFEEEVSPYEETGVQDSQATFVRAMEREETDPEIKNIVSEQTPPLFAQAIADECEMTAFMQLLHAKRFKLPEYSLMRQRFLQFVEYLLNEPIENIGEERKKNLEQLQTIVEKQTVVDVFPARKLSPEEQKQSLEAAERFQYENTPILFQQAIDRKDVLWAYEHLKKAYAMEMPEYENMRDRFMSLAGLLIDRGYGYYEELQKDPSYTKLPPYEKFKEWLKKTAEDVAAEKFAL